MKIRPDIKSLIPVLLVVAFVLLSFFSQTHKSVTVDEFCHFPSGIYHLQTADWRMNHESPPLIKCLMAIPAMFLHPVANVEAFSRDPNPWRFGYHFMFSNTGRYHRLVESARWVIILLSCLCATVIYLFSKELLGRQLASLAMLLYLFDPNIIAHSRLATIDIGATFFIFCSIVSFWYFLKKSDTATTVICGLVLGLAQLSKFTSLLLYPLFFFIFAVHISVYRNSKTGKQTGLQTVQFMAILILSSMVICAGYQFQNCYLPVSTYQFQSSFLKVISASLWSSFPVPLPYDYLLGFDSQMSISTGGNPFYAGYLMGEHSLKGWWYAYIVAIGIKAPILLLLLFAVSGFLLLTYRKQGMELTTFLCVWIPIAGYFFYFSLLTNIQVAYRYLLPVYPLVIIAAVYPFKLSFFNKRRKKICLSFIALVYISTALYAYPNYLSYFNLLIGGSENGHEYLIDSNLDWGQDLPALKRYMDDKRIEKINLGYFGRVDPRIYGIDYQLAVPPFKPGPYAISINYLVGRPYYHLSEKGNRLIPIGMDAYMMFRTMIPETVLNHTLYIFNVAEDGRQDPAN
jgi:hypothetical protein